jgi:glycosyltransferase involved in cell wall biosynthesis
MELEVKLTVVGKIDDYYGTVSETLAADPDCILNEHLHHQDLMRAIQNADFCIMPFDACSDLEQTYPIKILEYMQHGGLVVSSNIRGVAEIIQDNINGILFEPGNAADAAFKIRNIIDKPEHARRMRLRAREDVRRFDCRLKAKIIQQALERVAGFSKSDGLDYEGTRRPLPVADGEQASSLARNHYGR